MTYTTSFRRHVLAVTEPEGLTFAEASERFSVGIASLVRWSGKLEPKVYRCQRGLKIDLEKLAQDVRDQVCRRPPLPVGAATQITSGSNQMVSAPRRLSDSSQVCRFLVL